ncbi:unnamed protein product [Acanthoscelides obtectus]|uniref:peptidylprolyl isomerase n=1 Tax=Acanthoscelides obtectus TaxID=200917 RepID=A0A9P0JWG5_ACAOB|nr:unnamed protein product [Acanthoscelides obtectus]CAK1666017.1 Peptidyl-prolyl cis-trans isomerase FKBP20-1 [Acanthoscelides obtectus]
MSNAFIDNEKITETKNTLEHAKDTTMSYGIPQSLSGGDIYEEQPKINGSPPRITTNNENCDEIKEVPQSKEELATSHNTDALNTQSQEETSENDTEDLPEQESRKDATEQEAPKEEWTDLLGSGVIMKKIIIEGKPDTRAERSEKCIINYTGYLEDETVVESCGNLEVYLGEYDKVIQGLDVSLGLMNVGEKCRLKIQPRLAYGNIGLPTKIPPNTAIIYDVELVAVEPEPNACALSIQERKILG